MNSSLFAPIQIICEDSINIKYVFLCTVVIFILGLCGFIFNRGHLIITLISAELLLLSAFLNFSFTSLFLNDAKGAVYALMILVIAAVESAVGLSIIIHTYFLRKNISINSLSFLKG